MATIIARHQVGDITTWLAGHQERVDIFAPVATILNEFQDMDNPNSVLLLIEATDMEKFGAMVNDSANADLKDRHTVIEPIIISLPVGG
jgi:hypothetical protein